VIAVLGNQADNVERSVAMWRRFPRKESSTLFVPVASIAKIPLLIATDRVYRNESLNTLGVRDVHPTTKQIRDAVANSTDGLSEQQFRLHPDGKWDSAAILEHLALTFGTTASLFQKMLREGRPLATSPTLRHRAAQLCVLTFGYIPYGRKSPKRVEPTGITGREARELIFANLEKMDLAFAECEKRFGEKMKVADHPVLGPIRLSGWRKFHLLHTRHHMKQIDALAASYAAVNRDVAAAS